MIKFLIGGFFGFMIGLTYGIYQVVEVDGSKVVKVIKFIKEVVEAMS